MATETVSRASASAATIRPEPTTAAEPVKRYATDKISPYQVSAGIPLGEAFNDLACFFDEIHGAAELIALSIGKEEVPPSSAWALVSQLDNAKAFVQAMHQGYIAARHRQG